jgi:predicted dinucleotide-binding enzyme
VLVLGDDRAAKDEVIDMVGLIKGMRGIDAGALRLAVHVEGMTAALIAMNRRYKAHAGLRVTDV